MEAIKLATPEQVENIKATSDLNPESAVLSFRDNLAVVKKVTELDPIFYGPDETRQHKMLFAWGIENWLRLNGVPAYYFHVSAADETWQKNVETFGAIRCETEPQIHYKKVL
jgi:hypothetical protein